MKDIQGPPNSWYDPPEPRIAEAVSTCGECGTDEIISKGFDPERKRIVYESNLSRCGYCDLLICGECQKAHDKTEAA